MTLARLRWLRAPETDLPPGGAPAPADPPAPTPEPAAATPEPAPADVSKAAAELARRRHEKARERDDDAPVRMVDLHDVRAELLGELEALRGARAAPAAAPEPAPAAAPVPASAEPRRRDGTLFAVGCVVVLVLCAVVGTRRGTA